jgi:hypothetical protein
MRCGGRSLARLRRRAEIEAGEVLRQRARDLAVAGVLVRTLYLRLVEEDVLPAGAAELERGIEHGTLPCRRG